SHGEPVHTRDAFERALELPTWSASSLHIAAWHGDPELVPSLVQSSADRECPCRRRPECPSVLSRYRLCHIDPRYGVYSVDASQQRDATDERQRVPGGTIRGASVPSQGRGVPDVGFARGG